MFQVLLFPVADLRPLLTDVNVKRLSRPFWPAPSVGRDFLRGSGVVLHRSRGGTEAWANEDKFADASRALRFPDMLRFQSVGDGEGLSNITRVLRRFYSSGIVSRYEVALRVSRQRPDLHLDPSNSARWLAATARIPVRVSRREQPHPLLKAGPLLAKHFLDSSSNRTDSGPEMIQPWWVGAGTPALHIEYGQEDNLTLPPHSRNVLSSRVKGEALPADVLHHAWLEVDGQRISCWLLKNDDPSAGYQIRQLRIHLARLHCERECLRLVLEAVSRYGLGKSLGQADELEDYLQLSLPRLNRAVSYGIEQIQMLDVATTALNDALPGEITSYVSIGEKVARQVARTIRRAESSAPVITQIIETQMNTKIQMGTVTVTGDFNVVTAQNIQNSFNKAANAGVKDELKESLKALAQKVAELVTQLPMEKAEGVSKDLAVLTSEAISKEPRKAWYDLSADGLLEAAKTVAGMTAPVTVAVKAVLALL